MREPDSISFNLETDLDWVYVEGRYPLSSQESGFLAATLVSVLEMMTRQQKYLTLSERKLENISGYCGAEC